MDNSNNPYKKSFKTKREEYEEKLKQKSDNQEWIFGNYFGKPGGGAPLRDNQGNIVSSLKSISDMNIYRYEPQDFSKGNNNISVVNHKIYNQNNVISDPFSQSYDQINKFSPNQNISYQNNRTVSAINQNRNNIIIDENKVNYLNQQNANNNNAIIQQQMPYGYIIPYTNIVPYNQILPLQLYNNNVNNMNNNNYQNSRTNYSAINPQMNYLNKTQNYSSNNNMNNINNINNQNAKNVNNDDKKDDNYLIVSNDNEINSKIQREKKLEEWRNDLKKQKEEKEKRDLEDKKASVQKDLEERRKYEEFKIYKLRQAEEHAKKIKKQPYLNRNINNNFLELNNELELSKQTVSDFQSSNYPNNNSLKGYDIPPELIKQQENFKNYISQQYETLGQSLEQSISNEIKKMATMLTSKYEPFPRKENPNNYVNLKFENENAIRNEKKMQKLQDIIEERELLDFIIGGNDTFSPNKYRNYDIKKYNYKMSEQVPSFFGKNNVSYEKKNVNLRSSSDFIYDDYESLNKSKAKEYKSIFSHDEYENEQQKQNGGYNYGENKNNNLDINNNVSNSQSRKFGRNKENNINNVIDSIEVSQSLDNKTSFVPVNKDVDPKMIEEINKNINIRNEQQQPEYGHNINKNERQLSDKVEENIIKNLKVINKLNKDVILYEFDEKILQGYYNLEENNNNNLPQTINPENEKKNEEDIIKEKENEEQNGEKNDANNQEQPDIHKEEKNNDINDEENNNIKKDDEEKKEVINEENNQNNKLFSEIGVQNKQNANEAENKDNKVENGENKKDDSSPQIEIIENKEKQNNNEEKNKEKQQ